MGLVAVTGLLVGMAALAVLNSDEDLHGSVVEGICRVTTLGTGDCGEQSTAKAPESPADEFPTYRDPSLTPVQKATKGNYVALGDSFSSGEGGSEYQGGTDVDKESLEKRYFEDTGKPPRPLSPRYPHLAVSTDPYSNMCHRSTEAYGQRVARSYDFAADRFTFRACSGAVIDDFSTPGAETDPKQPWLGNDAEEAQKEYVDEDTTLITFSIGGNDAEFARTLAGCIGAGLNPFDTCSADDEREHTGKLIDDVGPPLTQLLRDMRAKAPNARIIVVGYPRFFPNKPDRIFDGTQIDKGDQKWINGETRHLNDVMVQAVRDAGGTGKGFEFVDAYDAFEGCEIGKKDSCMHNLDNGFANGKLIDNGSYHPNDKGHERLATMVEDQIENGG